MNGSVTSAKKNLTPSHIKTSAKDMASDVKSEVKSLADVRSLSDVQAFAESILGQSFENVDDVKAQIRKSAEEIQASAQAYGKTAVSYVKKNPGIFAALAAGIAIWFFANLFRGNKKV